jgi:hypothetical protein
MPSRQLQVIKSSRGDQPHQFGMDIQGFEDIIYFHHQGIDSKLTELVAKDNFITYYKLYKVGAATDSGRYNLYRLNQGNY